MKRILLTGFEPFQGDMINPSQVVVEALHGEKIGDYQVVSKVLPVVFGEAFERWIEAFDEVQPNIVISLGLAGGRVGITPERVAINVDDARIPDNKGYQPSNQSIVPSGPVAYWSQLPIQQMVTELQKSNIPASISNTAGTFVCNHLFYRMLHHFHTYSLPIIGGFIHIPYLSEQVKEDNQPHLDREQMIEGIRKVCFIATENISFSI